MKLYFYYTDSVENTHKIGFKTWEYHNLMLLIFDKGLEDWGDCKGRAWCGTCHIKIERGELSEAIDMEEERTLTLLDKRIENGRLACQIPITAAIHKIHFRFVAED